LSRNPASKQNFLKKYPAWRKKIDPELYELRMHAMITGSAPPDMASVESAVKTFYKADIPPCPFLEDDFCEIYPARPFVCRQSYALSDPENCRNKSGIEYAVFGDVHAFEMQMSHVIVHIMKNLGLNALVMCNAPMTVREFVVNGKAYIDFYVKNAPKKAGLQNL
jgi:Fe-S-cluster containining protein